MATASPIAPHASGAQNASTTQRSQLNVQARQRTRVGGGGGSSSNHHHAAGSPQTRAFQQQQQQQQNSPVYRRYNQQHHHNHIHHHHYPHHNNNSHQNSVDIRSPTQRQQLLNNNSSTSPNRTRSNGIHRHSPPAYTDLMLTPASATGSTHSAAPLFNNENNGASGLSVSPVAPPSPPSPLQLPRRGRYRSSLPVPPPLRSLRTPTTTTASDVNAARVKYSDPRSRQQHAEPSLRRGLPPPLHVTSLHPHSSTSSNSLHIPPHITNSRNSSGQFPTQLNYAHDLLYRKTNDPKKNEYDKSEVSYEEESLSTPVDQRIPAMVPPSYDAYNLEGTTYAAMAMIYQGARNPRNVNNNNHSCIAGAAAGTAEAAADGAAFGPYRSCTTSSLKALQPPVALTQLLSRTLPRTAKTTMTTGQREGRTTTTMLDTTAGTEGRGVAQAGSHPNSSHSTAEMANAVWHNAGGGVLVCEQEKEKVEQDDVETRCRTPCGKNCGCCDDSARCDSLILPHSPSCHHHRYHEHKHKDRQHTHTNAAYDVVSQTNGGVPCGMSPSMSEWCSPSSATRGNGAERTWRQIPSSNDDDDALDSSGLFASSVMVRPSTSVTPLTTPARAVTAAATTTAAQQHHFTSVNNVSVCGGQGSTPRELHLPLSSLAVATAGGAMGTARGMAGPVTLDVLPLAGSQRSSAPTVAISWNAAPDVRRSSDSTAAVATTRAATSTVADADPSLFLPPSLAVAASGVDHHPSVHLHYTSQTNFLFSVEGDKEKEETQSATAVVGAATVIRHAAPTSFLRLSSGASSSSMYCSPQQMSGADPSRPPITMESATTTPVNTSAHLRAHHGLPFSNNRSTTTPWTLSPKAWPEASVSSPMCTFDGTGVNDENDGWRSPLQWNPRQARDDVEMLAAKEVAQFALEHHRRVAAATAGTVVLPCSSPSISVNSNDNNVFLQSASPHRPLCACASAAQSSPAAALPCVFLPGGACRLLDSACAVSTAAAGDVESTASAPHRYSSSHHQHTQEESEEEWIELLLHYRDRENEGNRIRNALEGAITTTATPTATASSDAATMPHIIRPGDAGDGNGAAAVAATLAWWGTSSLMRSGFSLAPRPRATTTTATTQPPSSSSSATAFLSASPPPAVLVSAMSAPTAAQTIALQVRRQLTLRKEADRIHRWAYIADRLPMYAARREESLCSVG